MTHINNESMITKEMIAYSKEAIGIEDITDIPHLKYVQKLQELTTETHANLYQIFEEYDYGDDDDVNEHEIPSVTVAIFLRFLRLETNRCSNKRPVNGGLSEKEMAEKLKVKKNEKIYWICKALMATIGWKHALLTIENLNMDDRIEAAEELGTDEGDKKSEDLQKMKEKIDDVEIYLSEAYDQGCIPMRDAIFGGLHCEIAERLEDGVFELDLGFVE